LKEPKNSQKRWAEKFRLVESRGAVQDIEFAPGNGSLRLVSLVSRLSGARCENLRESVLRQHALLMGLLEYTKLWSQLI
jgi:hypothetical protein